MKIYVIINLLLLLLSGCGEGNTSDIKKINNFTDDKHLVKFSDETEKATIAGGCFWCIEEPFEGIDGVNSVTSGYSGGPEKNPSYKEVSSGNTGHMESVQIVYDPLVISYAEILDIYWKQFDPTDKDGSFHDRGTQYESAIFYHNDGQNLIAEKSKKQLNNSGIFNKPVVTEIIEFDSFYPAEEFHQDYYKKNPEHYNSYKEGSGRKDFIKNVWGNLSGDKYKKPSDVVIKKKLSELQYKVTEKNGTEPAFNNVYWDNHEKGIYVDIVTGEPLFTSQAKFESGTGWPSFTKPIDPRYVDKVLDTSHNMKRIDVRSRYGNSHLGHLFYDGPESAGFRYCLNSAALKFIPKDKMKEEGYGKFLWLID